MSPYMRAYKTGIKLAQLEWMNKVAKGEEDQVTETDQTESAPFDYDFSMDDRYLYDEDGNAIASYPDEETAQQVQQAHQVE